MGVKAKTQKLSEATKERAEHVARFFANVPTDEVTFFLAIANAYLDGLIAGRELRWSTEQ